MAKSKKQLKLNKIYCMDCLEGLKKLPDNSIDLITTDPPYQLSAITKARPDQTRKGSYGKEVPFSRVQSRIKGFMGKEWDVLPKVEIWKECLRVLKQGAFAFILMTPRQDSWYRCVRDLDEAGFMISFTPIFWTYASGFPKALNIKKAIEKRLRGVQHLNGSYGGFQPKPAVEVIIVTMKPLSEKTYVDQALKNHKGITWLDDCRIPVSKNEVIDNKSWTRLRNSKSGKRAIFNVGSGVYKSPQGRFPANLLVSDDILNDGQKRNQGHWSKSKVIGYGKFGGGKQKYFGVGKKDTACSFSRYFDLDKWFEQRIKKLPESIQKTFPFLIVPKPSKNEKNKGLTKTKTRKCRWNNGGEWKDLETKYKNIHPTVKPLKLMSYLITLGSKEGDIVLDTFVGSGTTCIAAQILNRKWIGIDLEKEYVEIAKARLRPYLKKTRRRKNHKKQVRRKR